MQTILGASGQIARELARELKRGYTDNLRLVSRHPQKVNDSDTTFSADLLDARQAHEAVKGSDTVYFTAGLPPDSALWERQFPTMLDNVLNATRAAGARFVYFDNTYMYPQNDVPQTEETPFAPRVRKGKVRAMMANRVLYEMARGDIPVLIGRAPEFYGPARTQSFTNALALLGNTSDAYGQTWHLPCCDERLTYQQFVTLAGEIFGKRADYTVISKMAFAAAGLFSHNAREIRELLPRYESDNLFDSAKFKQRFPAFTVTTYRQGLESIWQTSQL